MYNVSTGKLIKGGASKTTGSVLSMTLDTTSGGVWAADSKGSVFYFIVNTATGRLQRLKRCKPHPQMITSCIYTSFYMNHSSLVAIGKKQYMCVYIVSAKLHEL